MKKDQEKFAVVVKLNEEKFTLYFKGKSEADVKKKLKKQKFAYNEIISIKSASKTEAESHAKSLFAVQYNNVTRRQAGSERGVKLYG